jgi:eukaryotic-like serine/threonine-protein kinase
MSHVDTERNLLFGLVALQNGLIDQAQLVAAFQAWTRDKDRLLADHLVGLGYLDRAHCPLLEGLAALHLARHLGDAQQSLAAIPAGRSTQESLARIGDPDLGATLSRVGSRPTQHDDDGDADRTASYSVGAATSDGQRFRVLRPHARGGLGAVFVALDTELHREVALKQILDQHADDPVSRQRFLLEAEVTGGLEHPGIVPVYGLGNYGDGRPYYAMRFIKGDSLKEAIGRFHTEESVKNEPGRRSLELRKLLRRFTDVCNAIGYAHSRGVLHRDLKPGNIIVGKHGETLVVDWGLAKAQGRADVAESSDERPLLPSSASGSAETLPGSALGTPADMSPEQAAGELDRLSPRSDVYGLGATLYCLLTGKTPFENDDIGELLRQVRKGEFPPPRALDPAIDRALEAICLKAMATKPEDRYGSCRALADDIERWMADEPVTAWTEPWTRTLLRWLTRHRVGVTAAAAAGLVALVGLAAVAATQAQGRAALEIKNRELADANAKVRARYDLAVDAIKTFYTGVSEDFLLKEEKFKDLRNRLLKSAADFYGKLGATLGKEKDFVSRRALAASNFELADLTEKIGRKDDALAAHRGVLAAREAMAAEPGSDAATKVEIGRSLTAIASLLRLSGRTDEALATYHRSASLLAGLAESEPSARAALAACRIELGFLLYLTGKSAEALAVYKMALADQEALAAAHDASNEVRHGLARTIGAIGVLLMNMDKLADSETALRAAMSTYQKLADDNPDVIKFRSSLAYSQYLVGVLLMRMNRPAEAEFRAAMAIQQKLVDDNPAVTEFRKLLAMSHLDVATGLQFAGESSEAEAEYRAAMAILQKLAADNPALLEFRMYLAQSHYGLSSLLSELGKSAEAEAAIRTAVAIQQKLVDDSPDLGVYRLHLALSHNAHGWLLSQTGRPSEAEPVYREALAIQQKLADDEPKPPHYRQNAANIGNNLSTALRKLGRPAEAREQCERALTILGDLVREDPGSTDNHDRLAECYLSRGLTRRAMGDDAGAAADARRAVELYDALPSRHGERWFISACAHAALAGLAGRDGAGVSAAEATSEAETAVGLLRKAVGVGYRNPDAYRTEDALDPLRGREDFRLFMMDLAMPAEPFARAN